MIWQLTFRLLILSLFSNAWSSSKAEDLGSKSGAAIWPRERPQGFEFMKMEEGVRKHENRKEKIKLGVFYVVNNGEHQTSRSRY